MGCLNIWAERIGNTGINVIAGIVGSDCNVQTERIGDIDVYFDYQRNLDIDAISCNDKINITPSKCGGIHISAGLVCTVDLGKTESILWVKEGRFLIFNGGRFILRHT